MLRVLPLLNRSLSARSPPPPLLRRSLSAPSPPPLPLLARVAYELRSLCLLLYCEVRGRRLSSLCLPANEAVLQAQFGAVLRSQKADKFQVNVVTSTYHRPPRLSAALHRPACQRPALRAACQRPALRAAFRDLLPQTSDLLP